MMINQLKKIYHRLLAAAAIVLYGFPSRKIKVVAVTGTDGKTTTVNFIVAVLKQAGYKAATINTLNFQVGRDKWPNQTSNTTPGRFQLRKFIKRAVKADCDYLVLEVTSWAIEQSRIWKLALDVAVFTNLSHEHLDLHKNWTAYRSAKGKLFKQLSQSYKKENVDKVSLVNLDDPESSYFLKFKADKKLTYSLKNSRANAYADRIKYNKNTTSFEMAINGHAERIRLNLQGDYNIYNALAAALTGYSQKIKIADIKAGLESVKTMPGRLEKINVGQEFLVIVDFAHTPNAFKHLFSSVRQLIGQDGRLIAVFGSAGGRDYEKRPLLGQAAAELADFSILTSDDPRNEDPHKIAQQIEPGFKKLGKKLGQDYTFEIDRQKAIARALSIAGKGDAVVICSLAGAQYMYIGNKKIPWNETEITRDILKSLIKN